MIVIGLHTLLPQSGVYYTPPALRKQLIECIIANPPFNVMGMPTAPGKTLPAAAIVERLARSQSEE